MLQRKNGPRVDVVTEVLTFVIAGTALRVTGNEIRDNITQ